MPSTSSSTPWRTYEVCERNPSGYVARCPVSEALAKSDRLAQVVNKMILLRELGPAEAQTAMKDNAGRALVVKKKAGDLWLLKCKPSCWRLYFYVSITGEEKRIIYVHAVCKQQDKEDAGETSHANAVANALRAGRGAITLLDLPFG